jgi:hypothetical protein
MLILFSTNPRFVHQAVTAGVDGIIVDWETLGKARRQMGADTQINRETLDDLRRVRASTDGRVICRINGFGATTALEVEEAIGAGADELLLPMIRTTTEVETVLDYVGRRCELGILIETIEAVELVEHLARLRLSRVYVGLNDLAIQRGSGNIFTALVDGTVERIRRPFKVPFGFGGLTLPDRGSPIPCHLLISEMARLRCTFSFLRRSFYRDIKGRSLTVEIPRIYKALQQAYLRSSDSIEQDRRALEAAIHASSNVAKRQS